MLKKSRRWLSLVLAVTTAGLNATGVYAEATDLPQTESVIAESAADPEEPVQEEVIEEIESVPDEEVVEAEEAVMTLAEEEPVPEVKVVDHGDGTVDLEMLNYTEPSDFWEIRYAVWSAKDGQDDLAWYITNDGKWTLDLEKHKDDLGDYNIHVYEALKDGSMSCIAKSVLNVASITRPEPAITAIDQTGDEKTFSITLNNFTKQADTDEVTVAIWSTAGGQDDLKWYSMAAGASGTYGYSFKPEAHKTAGEYNVHVYERKKGGKMNFLGKTTLSVTAASATGVEVKNLSEEKGTAEIVVSGVTCPSGITGVSVPIWSQKNQSDLVWYPATAQADGTYSVTMDISRHQFNVGTYQIHVYATNGNGVQSKVGTATAVFKSTEALVTAESKDGKYLLKTGKIRVPGGVKEISYAVWSEENGQDDLNWFTAKYDAAAASASYTLSLSGFKSYGDYNVHCYAKDTAGKMVFLGKTIFTLDKPALDETVVETDNAKGTFKITVKGLDSSISKVQIPVWSKKDQSDIVWYDAVKDASGNYVVSSSIASHKYNAGTYNAHVYVTDMTGLRTCMDKKTFVFEITKGSVTVLEDVANTTYTAMINGLTVPSGLKNVEFAVWSEQGGQDDLKWYQATGTNGGNFTASIAIKNHKTTGKYLVHAYMNSTSGAKTFLGSAEFNVTTKAVAAGVTVGSPDEAAGTFKVTITIPGGSDPITTVKVPSWCAADQSDLVWYTAAKQADGTYTATIDVNKHKGNLGNYTIHVYTTFENGIRLNAAKASYTFNPTNFISVVKTKDRYRTVTLKNCSSSVSKVSFAVWSDDKGQDDLVWYGATKQSDGTWTATIDSGKHKSSGNYQVHCYQNGTYACRTTFSFAANEMAKNGWYYENGYKFYYVDGKKQTNVSGIIGAQGSYVAKINRTTCTVTIYANDPASNKGYIVPVIAFTCSVGLPGTPTTPGTHYTFAKYRWKELMGPSWGQYATKFTGDGIYFHSVAGINTTSYNLNSIDYNNLGIPASHGCVRLCVRDAKWIYDNCPLGMKVIVYDSGDPGPFGKPATIKIPAGQTWDPTDPNVR